MKKAINSLGNQNINFTDNEIDLLFEFVKNSDGIDDFDKITNSMTALDKTLIPKATLESMQSKHLKSRSLV